MKVKDINRARKNFLYLFRTGASAKVLKLFCHFRFMKLNLIHSARDRHSLFLKFISERSFSHNWFMANIYIWHYFSKYYDFSRAERILEIGSWQGMSTCFLALNFPNAKIDCVDTWAGADEHQSGHAASSNVLESVESIFDQNTEDFSHRIKKYKMSSLEFLSCSSCQNGYDLIYIDGSHRSEDVLLDAFLALRLVKSGGIIVFDDFLWRYYRDEQQNPAAAINFFLRQKADHIELLFVDGQVVIRKK